MAGFGLLHSIARLWRTVTRAEQSCETSVPSHLARSVGFACFLVLSAPARAAPNWPAAGAQLDVLKLSTRAPERPWRIYLDAGHGAPGNTGNRSVTCEDEADVMLALSDLVAAQLRATGRFQVMLSRKRAETPRYQDRIAAAEAFHADAIVSLHSDARGEAHVWQPRPDAQCLRNDTEPGEGVLFSDEGPPHLVAARARLARSIAKYQSAAGFPLYSGEDWLTLYVHDSAPGVYIDRRPKRQRVYFLRKPRIPSVIVETHHALDLEEAARWKEPRTVEAFTAGLAVGLDEALRSARK